MQILPPKLLSTCHFVPLQKSRHSRGQRMRLRRRAREQLEGKILTQFKKCKHLILLDKGIDLEELIDALSSFQEIEQSLDWYPRSREARNAVQYILIDANRL